MKVSISIWLIVGLFIFLDVAQAQEFYQWGTHGKQTLERISGDWIAFSLKKNHKKMHKIDLPTYGVVSESIGM